MDTTAPTPPRPWTEIATDIGGMVAKSAARAAKATCGFARTAVELVDEDARAHVIQLPLVALSNLGFRSDLRPQLTASDRSAGRRPVVLVHGLAGHPSNFALVAAWLRLHGHPSVHAADLRAPADIDAKAAALADFIEAVCAIEEVSHVDLVAHSLGGLIARAALAQPEVAERVRRVVTVATPHRGTYAARFAGAHIAKDLRPDADRIRALVAPPVPFATIVGGADVMVVPLENAQLEGAPHVELPGLTHYTVLAAPAALQAIETALD